MEGNLSLSCMTYFYSGRMEWSMYPTNVHNWEGRVHFSKLTIWWVLISYIFVCGCISNGGLNWILGPNPQLFSQASLSVLSSRRIVHRVQSWESRELTSSLGGGKSYLVYIRQCYRTWACGGSRLDHDIYMCAQSCRKLQSVSHVWSVLNGKVRYNNSVARARVARC